jgi:hypothetical protein
MCDILTNINCEIICKSSSVAKDFSRRIREKTKEATKLITIDWKDLHTRIIKLLQHMKIMEHRYKTQEYKGHFAINLCEVETACNTTEFHAMQVFGRLYG